MASWTASFTCPAAPSVTASTATAVANLGGIGKTSDQTAITGGIKPDLLIARPRRFAFIRTTLGYNPQ